MPWIADSGNSYRLCLLDTNALSEIAKRPAVEGRGFIERFPPDSYAPCFTPYSLFELRRRQEVYEKFVKFFRIYPVFMTTPYQNVLEEERASGGRITADKIILNAFTPFGKDQTYDLSTFVKYLFGMPEIVREERGWRAKEHSILKEWIRNAKNFEPSKSAPNAFDADRYVETAAIDTLLSLDAAWVMSHVRRNATPNLETLPSLRVMLYSQYYRIFNPMRKMDLQDVTDLRIIAYTPYVDAIVTEAFQAEILSKIRRRMRGLDSVEIATVRDIRPKKS